MILIWSLDLIARPPGRRDGPTHSGRKSAAAHRYHCKLIPDNIIQVFVVVSAAELSQIDGKTRKQLTFRLGNNKGKNI